jgi:hypothetical protein
MMNRRVLPFERFVSVMVAASLLGACSSPKLDESTCKAHANSASYKVGAVRAANAGCTSDADCRSVDLAASCFDACSSAVNASGVSAFEAAVASVEAAECEAFTAGGCKLIIPPCPPPEPPSCKAGHCQSH